MSDYSLGHLWFALNNDSTEFGGKKNENVYLIWAREYKNLKNWKSDIETDPGVFSCCGQ
jgi:hypothetical protein